MSKVKRVDKKFVQDNSKELSRLVFQNSQRLYKDAKYLTQKQSWESAFGKAFESLEEIVKSDSIKKGEINDIQRFVSHEYKAEKILQMSANKFGFKLDPEEMERYKIRMPIMRQDSTYSRLVGPLEKAIPQKDYWRKRTKWLMNLLNKIFDKK